MHVANIAMSSNGDAAYDNTHRAFLQCLFARQIITYADSKPILAAIQTAQTPNRPTLEEDVSQADLDNYIDAINTQLSPFDFEIRSTYHQLSRERIYALVNTTSDALTQMATVHTADEIAYVKRVLDAIFETHNTRRAEVMAITSMQALKLAKPRGSEDRRDSGNQTQVGAQSAALTQTQAERILASMVEEGWFELSAKGYHSLTPRALMELKGWLINTYNDHGGQESDDDDEEEDDHVKIKMCAACREIVTVGQRCPDLACHARVHKHCVRNLFRSQGVGEKAARSSKRTNDSATGERRRASTRDADADDGADDQSGLEE
ncbi:hypothetical protein LTR53_007757 [Teratosphaeriaceae sp. CCFEE 6253]|nr:hypothetical protein LTR53_007757 [Teratosphaeriaceae sp. CCFEE 6253]